MGSTSPRIAQIRSSTWWRSGLYVVVIASLTVLTASGLDGWRRAAIIGLAVLAVVAALLRQRYPYALLVVAWITTGLTTQAFLIPALFNIGVRRRGWRGLLSILLSVLVLIAVAGRGERFVSIDGVDMAAWTSTGTWLLNSFVVVVVPYLIGSALAAHRELTESYRLRAEHAEAERSARAAEAVLLERARIAREAHDVLGHKLSLLTMQAGGLELNANAGAQIVAEQAHLISRSARDALADLRSIIGSLDSLGAPDPDNAGRSLVPQDLPGIRQLVAESRASGAVVSLKTSDSVDHAQLPASVSRAAYRVVQEALTNAHRHAPGAPVSLSLTGEPGTELVIEIRNAVTYPNESHDVPGSGGRGLPGLQERARSVGGELTVTETDSVFIVAATLPWPVTATNGEGKTT